MVVVAGVVEAVAVVVAAAVEIVVVVASEGAVAVVGRVPSLGLPERAVGSAHVQPGRLGTPARGPSAGHIVDSSARLHLRPSCSSPPTKEINEKFRSRVSC